MTTESNPATAPAILRAAAETIEARAVERDQPSGERSMGRTVAAFNALTGHQLSERDGWLFMVTLKMARACTTPAGQADDYVDLAAYSALAGECPKGTSRVDRTPLDRVSDDDRAVMLWLLWHHQGASSPIGLAIRQLLGMSVEADLNDHHIAEARRINLAIDEYRRVREGRADESRSVGDVRKRILSALESARMNRSEFGFPDDRVEVKAVHFGCDAKGHVGDVLHPTDYVKKITDAYRRSWIIRPLEDALHHLDLLAGTKEVPRD